MYDCGIDICPHLKSYYQDGHPLSIVEMIPFHYPNIIYPQKPMYIPVSKIIRYSKPMHSGEKTRPGDRNQEKKRGSQFGDMVLEIEKERCLASLEK